jgi:hypothetical protein
MGFRFFDLLWFFDLVKNCNFQFVWCIAQNVFNLESWNLTRMSVSMSCCALGGSLVDLSSISRVLALDFVKQFHYVVLFVPWVLDLESTSFTGILSTALKLCTWDFACGFFSVLLMLLTTTYSSMNLQFSTCSCKAQKVFDLYAWNFTRNLVSMCTCAPWGSLVDLFNICKVHVLNIVKEF